MQIIAKPLGITRSFSTSCAERSPASAARQLIFHHMVIWIHMVHSLLKQKPRRTSKTTHHPENMSSQPRGLFRNVAQIFWETLSIFGCSQSATLDTQLASIAFRHRLSTIRNGLIEGLLHWTHTSLASPRMTPTRAEQNKLHIWTL